MFFIININLLKVYNSSDEDETERQNLSKSKNA